MMEWGSTPSNIYIMKSLKAKYYRNHYMDIIIRLIKEEIDLNIEEIENTYKSVFIYNDEFEEMFIDDRAIRMLEELQSWVERELRNDLRSDGTFKKGSYLYNFNMKNG